MIFSMDEFEQVMSRFELVELVKMGKVNRDFDIFDAWFRNQGFILSSSDEFEHLMDEGGWSAVLDDCSWYDVPSRLKSLIRLWEAE